jgi:Family of unknown function (DUF6526)
LAEIQELLADGANYMSEKSPQTFTNHGRIDPLFHYFVTPVLLICFIWSIVFLFHGVTALHIWLVVFSLTALLLCFKTRSYALKVQDRVIRLEERLRLYALLADSQRARIHELTEQQLIAIRFAADDEIPSLVEKILRENLDGKAIKKAINQWRPDHWRV